MSRTIRVSDSNDGRNDPEREKRSVPLRAQRIMKILTMCYAMVKFAAHAFQLCDRGVKLLNSVMHLSHDRCTSLTYAQYLMFKPKFVRIGGILPILHNFCISLMRILSQQRQTNTGVSHLAALICISELLRKEKIVGRNRGF
jgi:hypothetical protein